MKKLVKKLLALSLVMFSVSLLWAELMAPVPSDISEFSVLSYNENAVGKEVQSPVAGTVINQKKSGNKTTIVIECNHTYYWKGNEQTVDYELIITNIKDYKKTSSVNKGDVLGTITKDTVLLGRCKTLDPYLVLGSSYAAVLYKDLYYLQPGWIIQTTDTLSYRQVESFEACAVDYYNRWKAEDEGGEEKARYNSLFNYPELDSISFRMKLKKYPGELKSYGSLGITCTAYFGRNIWETYTLVDSKCEYTPVLCWQYNFINYLKEECKPGDEITIYGTFLALDHMEKRLVFNVRDFTVRTDEARFEERVNDVKTLE